MPCKEAQPSAAFRPYGIAILSPAAWQLGIEIQQSKQESRLACGDGIAMGLSFKESGW